LAAWHSRRAADRIHPGRGRALRGRVRLWRLELRPWAWTFGVVLEAVALVLAVVQLGRQQLFDRHILTIVLAGFILWYLATRV